jgi:glyoxylase-like metal-dependent hydrolase (beta-lactamase superfamily II)
VIISAVVLRNIVGLFLWGRNFISNEICLLVGNILFREIMEKTTLKPSFVASQALRETALYASPDVICPGIVKILAENPNDYTGPGTNTYCVGFERLWIVDPGPDNPYHIEAILDFVRGRQVAGILITHTHLDHSPAVRALKKRLDTKIYSHRALSAEMMSATEEDIDVDFVAEIELDDGAAIGAGEWRIIARHTPGHFPNHLCYYLPEKQIMFSGDHIMGWSTTAIVPPLGHLGDYLDSLDKIEGDDVSLMLPSHGPAIQNPAHRIQQIRDHRHIRHRQIEECFHQGMTTPADIVAEIYEGLSPRLYRAACGQVQAHLDLIDTAVRQGK